MVRRAFAIALLMVAVPVGGCIGDDASADLPEETVREPGGPIPTRATPTSATGPPPTPGGPSEHVHGSWPVGMRDLRGSRASLGQDWLTAANVDELGLLWSFRTNGSATGTPTLRDGRVYAATWAGAVYALDAATGEQVWRRDIDAQVDAPVTLWEGLALFGDNKGRVHALSADTGEPVWTVTVDTTTSAHIYATVVVHDDVAFVGVASDQESIRLHGDAPVDFRGSVVALDARTGDQRWRTMLVPENHTGAPVWGTPVVVAELGLLIFGTGNAYTEPAHDNTDAVIALKVDTGEIAWAYQATKGDYFTQANPVNPDWDFGSTPSLFHGPDGRLLVGIGQKSSRFWAFDAQTGELAWKNGEPTGGQGIIAGSAYADGHVVVAHTNHKRVYALDPATGDEQWSHGTDGMVFSAPAIVPGAVLAGDSTGTLYGVDIATGERLWNATTGAAGGVFGGLSVVDGVLYVPTVEKGFLGEHGGILAFAIGANGTGSAAGGAARAANEAALLNVAFQPDRMVVAPGSRVTWVNEDAIFHTATSGWDDGATFDFGLQEGDRASWVFDEPGTYMIYCKPHASPEGNGQWRGMVMTIVVETTEED